MPWDSIDRWRDEDYWPPVDEDYWPPVDEVYEPVTELARSFENATYDDGRSDAPRARCWQVGATPEHPDAARVDHATRIVRGSSGGDTPSEEASMEASVQVRQFQRMSLDELKDVRDTALETKLRNVDAETRQWIFAYIDGLIANAAGDSDELQRGE